MPKSSNPSKGDSVFSAAPLLANGQRLMFSMARLQGHSLKTALRMQIETLSFLKHRYEQDLKLIDSLTAAGGFNDALGAYSEFLQETMSEYSDEAGKIVAIGSKLASDTARNAQKEAGLMSENLVEKSVA